MRSADDALRARARARMRRYRIAPNAVALRNCQDLWLISCADAAPDRSLARDIDTWPKGQCVIVLRCIAFSPSWIPHRIIITYTRKEGKPGKSYAVNCKCSFLIIASNGRIFTKVFDSRREFTMILDSHLGEGSTSEISRW